MGIFSGFALDKLPAIHLPWKNTTDGMICVHKPNHTIWKSTPWIKKAHIQKTKQKKTNQKTYKTYVSSLACDLLRHIMLISPNQIECEVLLDIRHQTLIYLLKFTKTKTKITDKRTVNISTGPMQRKNATKWKINIYRINILFTNSFVTSIEINKQSLPSPEEIFTTIESCSWYNGSTGPVAQ